MEKDSADKATTELENSVTSEEQDSLADEKRTESNEEPVKDAEKSTLQNTEEAKDAVVEAEAATTEESEAERTETPAVPEDTIEPTEESPEKEEPVGEAVAKTEEPGQPEEIKAEPIVEETESTTPADSDTPLEETVVEVVEEAQPEVKASDTTEEQKLTEEVAKEQEPVKEESAETATKVEAKTGEKVDESNVPEADLAEQAEKVHVDEPHEEFENVDFTTYSKEELVEVIKKLGKDESPYHADKILQKIAPLFNKIRSDEKKAALEKFVAEGGTADEFQYRPDELSLRFDANYKLIKDKKAKKFREQESERTQNLVMAEELLVELRDFVDSDESSASFTHFKEIQKKWKDLGDVPSQQSRTLWANYNALIHRFYDQRSIYFELKELDRKKNYEAKLKLCEKAEALENVENLRDAIRSLNDLHHEFKHLGPVPKELQEELWQQFKAASDKVYERRKSFVHDLKEVLHENQEKKEKLAEKIAVFKEFNSDRIKDWNEKTKEVIAIQKEWEAIGGLPKEKAKAINKEFWGSFKQFFRNKHLFFKKLDADRDQNLVKKQELLAKAIELKDKEDWDKTSNELKNLQSQWREIGPVPEKMRKKLYDEFKGACDHFFDKRREGLKSSQDQYKENLKIKKEIISQIQGLIEKADDNLDKFNELRKSFSEAGYVPKKNIQSVKTEFHEAVEKFLNSLTILNPKEKTEISLESEFSGLANSEHSQAELYQKEQSVRRQIAKYEDDIALWENNLEFFAHSKSTDKLRDEVNKKIDDAMVQLDALKRQLKMLRSL